MFQTKFSGPNCDVVISWSMEKSRTPQTDIENDSHSTRNIFDRMNELYKIISKTSSEYVDCLKSIHGSSYFDEVRNLFQENNPNVSFITEFQQKEYSKEVFMLRRRCKQLIQGKKNLIVKHEFQLLKEQNDFDQRIRDIIKLNRARLNSVKQEVEDRCRIEISSFQTILEDQFKETLQYVTEQDVQCDINAEDEPITKIEPRDDLKATTSHVSTPTSNPTLEHDSKINPAELSLDCMEMEKHHSPGEELPGMTKLNDDCFSSGEHVEKLLAELPESQADCDSFVLPFPIEHDEFFKDDFWTDEKRKDMSLVNQLTKNFLNRRSLKSRLSYAGKFAVYTEYYRRNVFPCWEIRCLLRNKRFPTALHHDAHVKKYHPDGRTIFICTTCHWPESSEGSLKEHEITAGCKKRTKILKRHY